MFAKVSRPQFVHGQIKKDPTLLVEYHRLGLQALALVYEPEDIKSYEYSVLVTSFNRDLISIVQHCRDRAGYENVFD